MDTELTLIRGDTYNLTFNLTDGSGNPFLLTETDKCYFTVKKAFDYNDCVLQKRYGEGIEYNPDTGLYEIHLTQNCTCDLSCGWYRFDIKVKIADKVVKTLLRGKLLLENNATHRGNE